MSVNEYIEQIQPRNVKDIGEKQDNIITATKRGFYIPTCNYALQSQTATTDTWTFKMGGSGGTTVATVVITYTDATKEVISHVEQT